MRIIFLIFFILLFGSCNNKQEQYVLLISFDGFRSDYLDWYDTPNIHLCTIKDFRKMCAIYNFTIIEEVINGSGRSSTDFLTNLFGESAIFKLK